MRLFISGDTHGNASYLTDYLIPKAVACSADVFVQCGDFGFWEHESDGVDFLDAIDRVAAQCQLPVYALHGNHDNWEEVMARYGHDRDEDWFVRVRPLIRYIPQGHLWNWAGYRLRAFGGAYSIDKQWRLDLERKRWHAAAAREEGRRAAGRPPRPVPSMEGTLWFPREQMTDEEFAELMILDCQPVDVIFSHDKPRHACTPPIKDLPECTPNQDRLQLALDTLRPRWWFHGHLHHWYRDQVTIPGTDLTTQVVGLNCDEAAAQRFWKPWQSWCLLDLTPDAMTFLDGATADEAIGAHQ